mmetsp:Transcript_18379/g.57834  ORF Transcript_18379/g.57834 Transcript_18379/m.57834 type:complete len:250 (+) Transcript_18379:549-1298(+)
MRHTGRLLLAEAGHEVGGQDVPGAVLELLHDEAVQVEVAEVVHDQDDVVLAVEGLVGPGNVGVRRQVPHDAQLAVDGAQLADVLDGVLRYDLQGAGAEARVVGLEQSTKRASSCWDLVHDGVLPHSNLLLDPLVQIVILVGDVVEDLAREVPHEPLPGDLQSLRHLLLHYVDLLVDHRRGLLGHDLGPQDRLLQPDVGEVLRAVEGYDVVGPRLQKDLEGARVCFPALGRLFVWHRQDHYVGGGLRALV